MPFSRRTFLRRLAGTAASVPLIAGSGMEASGWTPAVPVRPLDGKESIRLSSNENPRGPSGVALDAIQSALRESCRYPGSFERELVDVIARHHRVAVEEVLVGCGSTEHLRLAVDAFTSRGAGVVTAAPSFETTPRYAARIGVPVTAVPVGVDLGLDLDQMLDKSAGAGLVYLCNPNNPTGTVLGRAAVVDFIERLHRKAPAATAVVDEAYFEYVDDPGYGTLIPLALADPRVVVLRTMSKVHGMAGLRIGYAIGRRETIAALATFRLTIGVNVLGAAAAAASLGDEGHLEKEKRRNREARDFTRAFFERAGFPVANSHTNFVMVGIRRPIETFHQACASRGVEIGRPFPPLVEHARISIGTMEEMRRAVRVFSEVLEVG